MSRFFRQAGDSDSDSEESDDELMSSGDDAPKAAPTAAKPVMSRFLRTAGSDSSDSDDSDDSESDSDDSDEKPRKSSKFLRSDSEDEDSEEEGKAGVRIMSAQERRLAEMEATGKAMDNALKINDWVAISNGAHLSFPFDSIIS